MATAARDMRRRAGFPVDGSLARDLDWEVRERELRHAGEAPRRREAAEQQSARQGVRTRTRAAQHVSPLSAAGFCAVAVLAVLVLMNYIQLTRLSADMVELRGELEALETENVVLTAQYEQIFDLASIREAAIGMGMTKPSSSQIYYLDVSRGDSAQVYQEESAGWMEKIGDFFHQGVYAVVEYFD